MDWTTLSLAEQLGNVGSDFDRAVRWKQKGNKKMVQGAMARALEQLDRTLQDKKNSGPTRREVARLREEVCRELTSTSANSRSTHGLQKYFLAFATLARRRSGL